MVLPIHLFKIDPFALYSRLLRYRVYPRQGYKKLRHDVSRYNNHGHVEVPIIAVVAFRRDEAAIHHRKIDGVFHLSDFGPREIVRETRSRRHPSFFCLRARVFPFISVHERLLSRALCSRCFSPRSTYATVARSRTTTNERGLIISL